MVRRVLEALEGRAQVLERPWTVGASAYQAVLGVHAPWIAEISPMQYAAMSKAAKAAYDKKRAGEWVASAAVKDQWRAAVLQAYAAGKFRREDPDVHPDADMVVFAAQRQAAQDAAAQQAQARGRENAITRADQVKVGDRVWVLMSGTYETVTRVSQKSVSVTGRFGPMRITMSERVPQLGWLSPHDLAAKG